MSNDMGINKKYSLIPQQDLDGRISGENGARELVELQAINSFDYENVLEDELTESGEQQTGNSSMRLAFFNFLNLIIGAGSISQPFAFKNCGLVGGIVVMCFLSILNDWTLRLIVINAQLSQKNSYQDTVNYCFGKYGKILLLLSISSFAYGGCMAFCVIIGDTIPHVLKSILPNSITDAESMVGWLFHRNTIIILFTTCISYPLSLNKDISKLAKASFFALLGMLVIVSTIIVRAPFVDSSLKANLTIPEWTVNINIFQGISVISFALVCHHNTIFIYNSLKNGTISKFTKLTHIACSVAMMFCLLMGVNGLVNFGDKTKGNILNNFKSDDNWINVARLCFGLNMLTTFPLEIFVVRDVLKDVVMASHGSDDGNTSHLELSPKYHFFITTFLVFSSMAVSLFTCNLGIILEVIGATSASLMAYIIPPLCYLKLSCNQSDFKNMGAHDKKQFYIWKVIPSIGTASFGLIVMIISLTMSVRTSMRGNNDGHCVVD